MSISIEATEVCERHYPKCGHCPIHQQCTAPHEWSYAGLAAHNEKVNAAAVKWVAVQ